MSRRSGTSVGWATSRPARYALAAVLACAAVLLLWLALVAIPERVYPPLDDDLLRGEGLEGKEVYDVLAARLELQSSLRGSLLAGLAGVVGVSGAVLAWRQFVQQRDEKREDFHLATYSQAVTNMASESPDVRVAGMHSITRLAGVSEHYKRLAADVLLTYLREKRPLSSAPKDPSDRAPALPADVQAALRLLVSQPPGFFASDGLQLQGLDLGGAVLSGAHLEGADLTGTRLVDARLVGADLRGADLTRAQLLRADVSGADWSGAALHETDLSGVDRSRARGTPREG